MSQRSRISWPVIVNNAIYKAVVMKFSEIRKRAESDWQKLQSSDIPLIMVGSGTCGRAAGAIDVD